MVEQGVPKGAWRVTTLLLLYMLVNFADKIVVGLAGVPIMKDLALTPEQFGRLGASFFLLFSLSAVAFGFIINRFPTRWVLLGLAVVWALTQFPMVGEASFTTLLICRVILGAGEGPAFSVALHAMFKWFPDAKRTLPTAILSQGSAFGVIFAVPALNYLIVNHSWHWAFGALGLVGLLWVGAWLVLGEEGPLDPVAAAGDRVERIPYARLLTTPTFIGCCVATFGAYWALALGLTWFTPFIVKGLGFSQQQAGLISIAPWICGAGIVLATGWLSQRMLARGVSTRASRGVLGAAPLVLGGALLLLVPFVTSAAAQLTLITIGSGLAGSIYVVCPAMIAQFTPTAQRGAVISIYGGLYTLAGVFAPLVMGGMISRAATPLEGYLAGYGVLAWVLIAAGLIGLATLWPDAERARLARSAREASAAPVAAA